MSAAVISHGIDIVEVTRIERLWQQHGARFLDRVYTPAEQAYCIQGKVAGVRLAGRFASKEAVLKTLGTGWRGGIEWTDIEVLPDPLGKPLCTLTGRTLELARHLGIRDILISISHAGGFATASAIACGGDFAAGEASANRNRGS
jgi:holo-[acyl-carrier protein] synthase